MPTNPKPVIKMKAMPVFRVHYQDFEKYVRQVFGFEFDFMFAEGIKLNGPCLEYDIAGTITQAQERMAGDLREGSRLKHVPLILNVLAKDDYIPRGRYLIETRCLPDVTEQYRRILSEACDPDAQLCRDFKHEHRSNAVFMSRVPIIEAALADQKLRGK